MSVRAARTYPAAYNAGTTHVVPSRWIAAAQMQFQRFRRATAKSRCSNVTKIYTGLFKFNLFNGISIPRGFAILDANLHDHARMGY